MTIWQDLEVGEAILGELAAVASGAPITVTKKVGSVGLTDTITTLPNGPAGTPFQVFSGNIWQIVGLVLADTAAAQAGAPIQIAEKIGNTWYGHSLTVKL